MTIKFLGFLLVSLLSSSSLALSHSIEPSEATIKFYLDISEGGSDSNRNLNKLQNYLIEKGCNISVSAETHPKTKSRDEIRFYFNATKSKEGSRLGDKNFLQAKTYSGRSISPAVVVRQNTATHIEAIDKMPVSFVKNGSKSGDLTSGKLKEFSNSAQLKMLESGNHMGALSLLLHKDAFATVIDFGFASQWLEKNNLNIISKGNTQEAGGIFLNKSARLWLQKRKILDTCLNAFSLMERKNKKHNRFMQAFPDWLVGFEIVNED